MALSLISSRTLAMKMGAWDLISLRMACPIQAIQAFWTPISPLLGGFSWTLVMIKLSTNELALVSSWIRLSRVRDLLIFNSGLWHWLFETNDLNASSQVLDLVFQISM